ncbi:Protein BIG GRAIN 1-like [Quillaja saponaria]|uniref:Protein BIG GRAIN 1-like n=1 Tax=Quillaja saponaria TaxID=32244 RepID=A0AAD7L592_QUISA|nr:Protein BIG GRAIN 1-like [Quillaja saponaria]
MDKCDKFLREDRHRHRRENPSFSSTLLDSIYRSIDEGHAGDEEDKLIFYSETMRKKKQSNCFREEDEAKLSSFHRTHMIENWMEKKVSEKVVVRRNSSTEFDRRTRKSSNSMLMNSSSSSSDSSCGGGFSSSESDSLYNMQRPKPIRTNVSTIRSEKSELDGFHGYRSYSVPAQKPKHENGFVKTKSKALRILYGDLKKAKQPISPGARLASFLNSLFTSGGSTKKAKVSNSVSGYESKSAKASTCSSASSFSRSCLSKTPSSRSGTKRSVKFCPVSVIVDEDCRPCGQKNLPEDEPNFIAAMAANATIRSTSNEELKFRVMQESHRVEQVARDLLKNYQKSNVKKFDHIHSEEDDMEEDDGASCSSSDLFELDNLSATGIERYREELPVYETTHFHTNQAIANGFIL